MRAISCEVKSLTKRVTTTKAAAGSPFNFHSDIDSRCPTDEVARQAVWPLHNL